MPEIALPAGGSPLAILSSVLSIVVIDLVLSGDNAVVIGMAAHRLPARQRRMAIMVGGGAAIVLRVALTAIAALLLAVPGLGIIGGLLLLWIAYRLLESEEQAHDAGEARGGPDAHEGEPASGAREGVAAVAAAGVAERAEGGRRGSGAGMRGAVGTILLADVVMSLDNVLGVAAASGGEALLLAFGLGLSVGVLMLGGSLVAGLIDRLWWLVYLGTAVIAWTGVDMVLDDPLLERWVQVPRPLDLLITGVATVLVVGVAHYVHRYRPARADGRTRATPEVA